MSAGLRATASRLREKYARVFDVPIDDVVIRDEGWPDRFFVWAPTRPDLPKWDTGTEGGS